LNEVIDRALREFDAAGKALRVAPGKAAQGAENRYGIAYQNLVRLGVRPQIRYKYRVPKR
jgi:hypothetical protein